MHHGLSPEGNNKRYARVKVLKSTVHHIEDYLKEAGIELPEYDLFEEYVGLSIPGQARLIVAGLASGYCQLLQK